MGCAIVLILDNHVPAAGVEHLAINEACRVPLLITGTAPATVLVTTCTIIDQILHICLNIIKIHLGLFNVLAIEKWAASLFPSCSV